MKNIRYTVKNKMCTGCGICEDVCPKHCITIQRLNGEHRPKVDEDTCNKCGKCLKVCPGVGIEFQKFQVSDSSVSKSDKFIGNYVGLHTGYSLDEEIRYHSASGGMVSQFLIYLLEKKVIDGAVVTAYAEDRITPISYIARTREDVVRARSSKYCPVALNRIGNDIVKDKGSRFVIIGVPCHIQGFRKRAAIDKKFREKIIGYFSLYCSSGRTFYAQDYILRHCNVNKDDIRYFSYRDNGCLGNLTIVHSGAAVEEIPYTSYYGPMLRSFFKPHRCLTCIDHYGELADVCFGDIHIKPYEEDTVGISSWITRNDFWEEQFQKAAKEGYIKMDEVDAQTLNKSQADMLYPKKRRAKAVMTMDKMIGRAVPLYDRSLDKPGIKDYISEIICHCQRFVGRHKGLWWIVEALGKGK